MSENETITNDEGKPGGVLDSSSASTGENDETETEIRDTDIVFDCPHCGHNLAIDYRGAGLQISCVNCGESVLVPIPDGMKIDDLDIEPGEILKQLFAARRNLQRLEFRIEELEQELRTMTIRRDTLMAGMEFAKRQLAEFEGIFRKQADLGQKASAHLGNMMEGISSSLKDEVEFAKEDGGEDGAPSK